MPAGFRFAICMKKHIGIESLRMHWLMLVPSIATGLLAILPLTAACAAEAKVAVAANFTEPAKEIATLFEQATGHKLVLSFGATGPLYAQITQAAPFEVFLSADKKTPAKAMADGHAVQGTQFTYAVGKLVLFSTTPSLVTGEQTLRIAKFSRLAIANPATAPYGTAAIEVMKTLGVETTLASRLVYGQNIGQTYQFVRTGNAELGFVALAQIAATDDGSRWIVPGDMHTPILQDAVLLKAGEGNSAARAFIAFLKSKQARAVIQKFGYGSGE